MGFYDPPDPLIFPCPVGEVSNEDCCGQHACSNFETPENDDESETCVHCEHNEDDHHDCYDEADKAGVFDPPERDDY